MNEYDYYSPIRRARYNNELKLCEAHHCQVPRYNLSAYCGRHTSTYRRYGHPHGHPVPIAEARHWRAKVHSLFASNTQHEGVKAALHFVEEWMAAAVSGDQSAVAGVALQRLDAHQVTPLQVLEAATACFAWSAWLPRSQPNDKAHHFALSRAVLGLAPRERRQGLAAKPSVVPFRTTDLHSVADYLKAHLSRFFMNVYRTLEAEQAQQQSLGKAFDQPFYPTPQMLLQVSAMATAAVPAVSAAVSLLPF